MRVESLHELRALVDRVANDRADSAIVMIGDHDASKVAVAWQLTTITIETGAEVDDGASLEELWGLVKWNLMELASRSGIPSGVVMEKFWMLRSMELIYPDGRIAECLRMVIKRELFGLLVEPGWEDR